MALGVVPGLTYAERSIRLAPGDSLFLYTDGVSEAQNPRGEQYGEIRLMRTCADARGLSPRKLIASVSLSTRTFAEGADPNDDVTMLALTYKRDE